MESMKDAPDENVSKLRLCWIQHTTFAEKLQGFFAKIFKKHAENRIFGETHKFDGKFPAN